MNYGQSSDNKYLDDIHNDDFLEVNKLLFGVQHISAVGISYKTLYSK